jgi:hypothetical protein
MKPSVYAGFLFLERFNVSWHPTLLEQRWGSRSTAVRRARQAAISLAWKPWERSTGPRTPSGRRKSSRNALSHGGYTEGNMEEKTKIKEFLEHCFEFI